MLIKMGSEKTSFIMMIFLKTFSILLTLIILVIINLKFLFLKMISFIIFLNNYTGYLGWKEFLDLLIITRNKNLEDKINLFIKIADK
jgi:hypothetical protein